MLASLFPYSYVSRFPCDLPVETVVFSVSLCMPQNTFVTQEPPNPVSLLWLLAGSKSHFLSSCKELVPSRAGQRDRDLTRSSLRLGQETNLSLAQSLVFIDRRGSSLSWRCCVGFSRAMKAWERKGWVLTGCYALVSLLKQHSVCQYCHMNLTA